MKSLKVKNNLLSKNEYLSSGALREKATLISVRNSCLLEGISCPELMPKRQSRNNAKSVKKSKKA